MLGATVSEGKQTRFEVWAPRAKQVVLCLGTPDEQRIQMQPLEKGYFATQIERSLDGMEYVYELNGERRADPASRSQPHGALGPSQVVDLTFPWSDHEWHGAALRQLVFYELHVGTFSPKR